MANTNKPHQKPTSEIKTPGAGEWGTAEDTNAADESAEDRLKRIRAEKDEARLRFEALELQERAIEADEHAKKIKKHAEAIKADGLTLEDIANYWRANGWPLSMKIEFATGSNEQAPKKAPAPPKFKNPTTGETHSGRGQLPAWLREARDTGKLEEFRIPR